MVLKKSGSSLSIFEIRVARVNEGSFRKKKRILEKLTRKTPQRVRIDSKDKEKTTTNDKINANISESVIYRLGSAWREIILNCLKELLSRLSGGR